MPAILNQPFVIASRFTLVEGDVTDVLIADGEPITVYGVTAGTFNDAVGNKTILFEEANSTTAIFEIRLTTTGSMEELRTPFIADKGIQVTVPADGYATVFHNHPGS